MDSPAVAVWVSVIPVSTPQAHDWFAQLVLVSRAIRLFNPWLGIFGAICAGVFSCVRRRALLRLNRIDVLTDGDRTGSRRCGQARGALHFVLFGFAAVAVPVFSAPANQPVVPTDLPVTYEAFGAIGDGVADDLPAIVEAHAFANAHGLPVTTKPGANYHLGRRALTAIIATDTDWGTSRFVVDDTDVENHQTSLFAVRSLLKPVALSIPRVTRDQRHLDLRPARDCWVRVENNRKRLYIRQGLNQNNGSPQRDCFILRRDGTVEGDIDWDYDTITKIEARPLDEQPLVLKGGVFTTTANRMKQDKGYNYWSRNITITTRLVDTAATGMLLRAVNAKSLDPAPLITHRFTLDRILDAYDTFGLRAAA